MNTRSTKCPNKDCRFHENPEPGFYTKMGYYKVGRTRRLVPRYRCSVCGKSFSSRTSSPSYGQRKPQVNDMVMQPGRIIKLRRWPLLQDGGDERLS